MSANDKQIAGKHYKMAIEPWDAIEAWGLSYLDGSAVKYLSRWRKKGGVMDLHKAKHFIEKLIEVENGRLLGTHNPDTKAMQGHREAGEQERQGSNIERRDASCGSSFVDSGSQRYVATTLSDII